MGKVVLCIFVFGVIAGVIIRAIIDWIKDVSKHDNSYYRSHHYYPEEEYYRRSDYESRFQDDLIDDDLVDAYAPRDLFDGDLIQAYSSKDYSELTPEEVLFLDEEGELLDDI